ncbi:hypothetical protein [Paenibacillus sp. FSL H8-0332]|uniref:hypothetical protein n=1 Tax=Paenibacillus sp. FSL H8-0332 TaxID=2954742 RepID=UPI0030D01F30
MELIGLKVMHIRFGEGEIVSNTENRVDIHFVELKEKKGFIYPDAFVQYLWIQESEIQEFIVSKYYDNQKEIVLEKQRQMQLKIEENKRELAKTEARKSAASKRKSSTRKK